MTSEDAIKTLLRHGPGLPNDELETFSGSLLARSRPAEAHFWDIVRALHQIAPEVAKSANIDKRVPFALWIICDSALTAADRQIQNFPSTASLSAEDRLQIGTWGRCLASVSQMLLRGDDVGEAFLPVAAYVATTQSIPKDAAFLISEFETSLKRLVETGDDSWEDDLVNLLTSIGKIGNPTDANLDMIKGIAYKHSNAEVRDSARVAAGLIEKRRLGALGPND